MVQSISNDTARRVAAGCALFVAGVCAVVLAGFALDVRLLQDPGVRQQMLRPNAAVALLCLALALLIRRVALRNVLAAFALGIGLATGFEWLAVVDLGIDGLLDGRGSASRMALRAAAGISFGGAAVLCARWRTAAQILAGATGFLAVLSIVAVLFGARILPSIDATPIALPTACLFALWSLVFLLSVSDGGPLALLFGRDRWASAARRGAAVALGAPVVFGFVCLTAAEARLFDFRFAVAAIVTASSFTLVFTMVTLTARTHQSEVVSRASEARFRRLYDSNIIGVAFWSFDGIVHEANDELLRIFGVSRSVLAKWRWAEHNTAEGDLAEAKAMDQIRANGRCDLFEKECIRTDGTRVWLQVTAAVLDGDRNIAFVSDVTERVGARRALERAHEILADRVAVLEGIESQSLAEDRAEVADLAARLAAATEELETFSYSVSHDLRAPLRAIDGFSRELMLNAGSTHDEQNARYLTRIRAATQRMSRLIDDLLDLSRLSRRPMARQRVDVSALAADVASELGAPHVQVQPGLTATADPHLLRVVLQNLISNAVKFSSQRADPCVEVFAAGDGVLAVRDNGVGFDMQYAGKLFAPFQRLHAPTAFEGTGIGLALVQRVIRRHGGQIRAEAAPDRGATFFFTLGEAA